LVKEGGPYVVALVGMAAGYFGGRGTGRESRHHARVEALYQDMLDDLAYQSRRVHDAVGVEILGQGPPGPEVLPVSDSRIRLYASPSVSEAWGDALFTLHILSAEGKGGLGDRATQELFKSYAAEKPCSLPCEMTSVSRRVRFYNAPSAGPRESGRSYRDDEPGGRGGGVPPRYVRSDIAKTSGRAKMSGRGLLDLACALVHPHPSVA
jgi:hypothetical protein